jgi:hypothetical protein
MPAAFCSGARQKERRDRYELETVPYSHQRDPAMLLASAVASTRASSGAAGPATTAIADSDVTATGAIPIGGCPRGSMCIYVRQQHVRVVDADRPLRAVVVFAVAIRLALLSLVEYCDLDGDPRVKIALAEAPLAAVANSGQHACGRQAT